MQNSAYLSEITTVTRERAHAYRARARKYGLSLLRLILPLLLLSGAVFAQEAAPAVNPAAVAEAGAGAPPAAPNRQDFPRPVAVYVTGGVSDNERAVLASYLLAALVNSGACVSHENSAAFLAAVGEQSKRQVVLDDNGICQISRHYGIKYVCAASVTPAFGAPGTFTVFARMLNTETGKARLTGEATGPLATAEDLTLAANTAVERLLGRRVLAAQPAPEPEPEPAASEPPPPAEAEPGKLAVAVYMAGKEPKSAKGAHNIIGGELAKVINESDKYSAADRTEAILQQLDSVGQKRGGEMDADLIKTIGHQLGVHYLCVSDIKALNSSNKRYRLDTRLVDIVTAETARSVKTASNLNDADEMARVGRSVALELLGADRAEQDQSARRKTILRGTAISLDALGALAFAYGCVENSNVVKNLKKIDYNDGNKYIKNGPGAEKAAARRDVAYIVGGALLASGVAIHIFF